MAIGPRKCWNVISDVVNNRPRPLREFDQIFMKTADLLPQTEHGGSLFDGTQVVFIGDGDATGACLAHLHGRGLLQYGPQQLHMLEFDERFGFSVERCVKQYRIAILAVLGTIVRCKAAVRPHVRWVETAQLPDLLWAGTASVLQLSITLWNR